MQTSALGSHSVCSSVHSDTLCHFADACGYIEYIPKQCNCHGSKTDFLILECLRSNPLGMWPCIRNNLYNQKDTENRNYY